MNFPIHIKVKMVYQYKRWVEKMVASQTNDDLKKGGRDDQKKEKHRISFQILEYHTSI